MSEDNTQDHSSQFSIDFARREGLRIVLPKFNEVQVDIDTDAAYAQYEAAYSLLTSSYDVIGSSERPSRNGGEGRHITVRFGHALTQMERIALQAVMGSDFRREIFSLERLKGGEAIPTLFYEKP